MRSKFNEGFFLAKNKLSKQDQLAFRDLILIWTCIFVGCGSKSMFSVISIFIDTHKFNLQIHFACMKQNNWKLVVSSWSLGAVSLLGWTNS